ncbi:MAG: ABC transporter permease [Solirubrobacteraceae bacterium]
MSTPLTDPTPAASSVPATTSPRGRHPAPSLARLVLVELRKTADTRSGRWLLIAAVAIALIVAVVRCLTGDASERTLTAAYELTVFPLAVLLPVMGILLVTSEWSQRTALTTFALVPHRSRIVLAKLGAGVLLGVAAFVLSLLAAAIGNIIGSIAGGADGSWSVSGDLLYQTLIGELLSILIGVGFGLVFVMPALAIVMYFALPTVFSIVGELIDGIRSTLEWIDMNVAFEPLFDGSATGDDWGKIVVASIVWVGLPVAVGTWRVLRREVK